MRPAEQLRNLCLQLEQEYLLWQRPTTYRGVCLSQSWPPSGYRAARSRTIEVQRPSGEVIGTCKIAPGLADALYLLAVKAADLTEQEKNL